MMDSRTARLLLVLTVAIALPAGLVRAQSDEPAAEQTATKKKTRDQGELEARINQLERQMLDMQVVIGTLESMTRQGNGSGAALGSDAEARIGALETQLQALTAEVRALGGQAVSSISVPPAAAPNPDVGDFSATTPDEEGQGLSDLTLGDPAGAGDPIGDVLRDGGTAAPSAELDPLPETIDGTSEAGIPQSSESSLDATDLGNIDSGSSETEVAALGDSPEQAYEVAYGHLLQQDYEAAESGFSQFLKVYPKSKLAGNAQYWLGETHYVRGNYKAAADAFLTGYKKFRKGQKAPDSLMKLAMALSRLGEKEAACSAFAALENEFPKLQAQLRRRADSERERAGCASG
ncbi:MAG: tol-pal system protein YbgF [Hyphomicrobiaceae bacterium]